MTIDEGPIQIFGSVLLFVSIYWSLKRPVQSPQGGFVNYRFRKASATKTHRWNGKHRFEHWYRDNTVYFLTSRVRGKRNAFESERAKEIFWDRFEFYAKKYDLVRCIETLMSNHYHAIFYAKRGESVGEFVQHLHGSVAKLVNDILPSRHLPFWRTAGNRDYYDGCLRDEKQLTRAYRYTRQQSVRARLVKRFEDYPHTRIHVSLDETIFRATRCRAIPIKIPYARYENPK